MIGQAQCSRVASLRGRRESDTDPCNGWTQEPKTEVKAKMNFAMVLSLVSSTSLIGTESP